MTYTVSIMKGQKTAITTRRKYDEEFKRNALKLIEQGQSVRSVSQALGVAEGQLHKWKRAARRHASPNQEEVTELRAQLRQLQIERDILKKALAIFSRQM
jgi:transposase